MFPLEDRLKLKYMDQVEFIRFRDVYFEAEKAIRQLEYSLEDYKRRQQEAVDEIERLFKEKAKEGGLR